MIIYRFSIFAPAEQDERLVARWRVQGPAVEVGNHKEEGNGQSLRCRLCIGLWWLNAPNALFCFTLMWCLVFGLPSLNATQHQIRNGKPNTKHFYRVWRLNHMQVPFLLLTPPNIVVWEKCTRQRQKHTQDLQEVLTCNSSHIIQYSQASLLSMLNHYYYP